MNTNKINHLLEEANTSLELACEFIEALIESKKFEVELDNHKGFIALLQYVDSVVNERVINLISKE